MSRIIHIWLDEFCDVLCEAGGNYRVGLEQTMISVLILLLKKDLICAKMNEKRYLVGIRVIERHTLWLILHQRDMVNFHLLVVENIHCSNRFLVLLLVQANLGSCYIKTAFHGAIAIQLITEITAQTGQEVFKLYLTIQISLCCSAILWFGFSFGWKGVLIFLAHLARCSATWRTYTPTHNQKWKSFASHLHPYRIVWDLV